MSKKSLDTVKTVIGIAIMSGSLAAPLVAHAENPFVLNDLGSGYQVADKHAEGKCGGDMPKDAEGKCGEGAKDAEGKCGGSTKDAEGKCGGDAAKDTEGKCGEGKCGEGKQ